MQNINNIASIFKDKLRNKPIIDSDSTQNKRINLSLINSLLNIVLGIIIIFNSFSILGIFELPEFPKISKPIDVSQILTMSADEADQFLGFDDYSEGLEMTYYVRRGGNSCFEFDEENDASQIPSYWNLYIKDNAFSLYGIIVDKTTITMANKILTQKGWIVNETKDNYFRDSSIPTVEYLPTFGIEKKIFFKIRDDKVEEIQLLYLPDKADESKEDIDYEDYTLSSLPNETPNHFFLYTGVGATPTNIILLKDGSFTGSFMACEEDEKKVYYSDFSGQFTDIRQVNKHTWSMKLKELNIQNEIGTETQGEDGYIQVGIKPYGIDDESEEYLLYMMQTPIDELKEEALGWVYPFFSIDKQLIKCAVIYDVNSANHYCFVGFPDL